MEGRSRSNAFWPGIRAESWARLVAGAGFEPVTSGITQEPFPDYVRPRIRLETLGLVRRILVGHGPEYRVGMEPLPIVSDAFSMTSRIL